MRIFNFLHREPNTYPDAPPGNKDQTIKKVLEYRQRGLKPFKKICGSVSLPFEREGVETPDRRLRYFSEFGEMGSFSYLILDGYDCIDSVDELYVNKLVYEGCIIERKKWPSLYDLWKGAL